MSDTQEEVTPRLYDHAVRVYEEMLKRSHKEFPDNTGGETFGDADQLDIYEGHLTRLFADLQIANPYYTKIRDALVAQNCMEQIRRGGGVATSRWVLHHPPDEETFRATTERRHAPKGKNAVLEQRVSDLMRMVGQHANEIEKLTLFAEGLQKDIDAMRDDLQTMKRVP